MKFRGFFIVHFLYLIFFGILELIYIVHDIKLSLYTIYETSLFSKNKKFKNLLSKI